MEEQSKAIDERSWIARHKGKVTIVIILLWIGASFVAHFRFGFREDIVKAFFHMALIFIGLLIAGFIFYALVWGSDAKFQQQIDRDFVVFAKGRWKRITITFIAWSVLGGIIFLIKGSLLLAIIGPPIGIILLVFFFAMCCAGGAESDRTGIDPPM